MKVTSNTQKTVNSDVQKMIIDKLKGFEFNLLNNGELFEDYLFAYIEVNNKFFKIVFNSGRYSVTLDNAYTKIILRSRMKTMTTINKAIIEFS